MTRVFLFLCILSLGCSDQPSLKQQARDTWIADWQSRLASGEHNVTLYSTENTNLLLRSITGNPKVESLVIRQTVDLDETGLAELPQFPALSRLTVAGEKTLNDGNIGFVIDCAGLEFLELECTGISSSSFPAIAKLATLSSLNIETCDPDESFADDDVLALARLTQLRYLNLNGAASSEALRELATRLPNCTISYANH